MRDQPELTAAQEAELLHVADQLLAVAMSYDNRRPGQANRMAWAEAARRGRWTLTAAVDAIHEHYARSTEFLMPGHITALIRQSMRQPQPAGEAIALLEAAQPADESTRERFVALMRDRFAMPPRLRDAKGQRRERRPARRSADDAAAREQARRELDEVRRRAEAPDDPVG